MVDNGATASLVELPLPKAIIVVGLGELLSQRTSMLFPPAPGAVSSKDLLNLPIKNRSYNHGLIRRGSTIKIKQMNMQNHSQGHIPDC